VRRMFFVFVALPLVLAACGGSTYGTAQRTLTPAASVRQAAAKTSEVPSAHITLNASGSAGMFNGTVTGTGDFDNANHRGSFNLDVSGYGSVEGIVDGTTAYFKAPFLAAFLPAGKTWVKLKATSAQFGAVPQDPKQALARLKKIANVHEVGEETIDGVDTTHYHGTGRLGRGAFDVWIGKDDGYVRRLTASGNGKAKGSVEVTLSDFGKSVTVTPPPAAETADASALTSHFFKRS
jgi:LppX/LprAFG-like lipoprotein